MADEKENKKENDDFELLKKARERAMEGATYWSDNWEAAEEDLLFLSGEQWPQNVRNEREIDSRPCLTNNVLPVFVEQIIGDQLQNKPSIKVSSTDVTRVKNRDTGKQESLKIGSQKGTDTYELAEVLQGIIKNIEYNCDAEDAYDTAFQAAVESGMGFLRVRNDYLDNDSFEQDLIIEAIENQFSVTIDPMASKYDKSDANWMMIDDEMLRDDFEQQYPDAMSEPINGNAADLSQWFRDNTVRISEYFTRDQVIRIMLLMSDGQSLYEDEVKDVLNEMAEKGITVVRTRKVKTHKVTWRKITGMDVLEGPIEIKCSTIPIVPVFGKSITIKNKKIYRSAIRYSKDAQRMANYWDSAATESVALAPKAPFIGQEGHIEGNENDWRNANTENKSILTYIPQYPNDPGPRREQPAAVPAAEITLGMHSSDKIKSTIGMFDAAIGERSNEVSGKAILARQKESDIGSFRFIDNLSKSIRRVGRLLVELIPSVYDSERIVRLKFLDETEDFVKLNERIWDNDNDKWVTINDVSVGKYDVSVATGPAYTTQRQQAAEAMVEFAKAVPNAAGVIADLIALNMDWPGADVIAERLKKIIPPNVLSKDEREALKDDQPDPEEPSPEQMVEMKDIEARSKEADAKIAQAEAKALEAQLDTDDAKAKLAMIEGKADGGNVDYQTIRELVAEALAEIANKSGSTSDSTQN